MLTEREKTQQLLDGISLAMMTLASSFRDAAQMRLFAELLSDARAMPDLPVDVDGLLSRLETHARYLVAHFDAQDAGQPS